MQRNSQHDMFTSASLELEQLANEYRIKEHDEIGFDETALQISNQILLRRLLTEELKSLLRQESKSP